MSGGLLLQSRTQGQAEADLPCPPQEKTVRRTRLIALAAVAPAIAGCAAAGPSGLGYGLPAQTEVTYAYTDTTVVSLSMLGQSMEMAMRGSAEYDLVFSPAAGGVGVTLTVRELSGSLGVPMSAAIEVDEGDVEGNLVFSLDREGNATVTSTPSVSEAASRMISGLGTAHTFFPGLPGVVVSQGDQWVDTVSYEGDGDGELGATSELTVLRYTVVGDTAVAGRSLLNIALSGTTELSNSLNIQGMRIAQSSVVDVEGHVLWDARSGLMFEMVKTGRGRGTVSVPISPQPIPIEVRITQRARLLAR